MSKMKHETQSVPEGSAPVDSGLFSGASGPLSIYRIRVLTGRELTVYS